MSESQTVCALCGHTGRGEAAELHLTHGVSVWLCPPHRSPAFLRRRCGRTFTARLEAIWRASNIATVPSVRTMRRWFTQGRWLTTDSNHAPRRWRPRRSSLPELPQGMMRDPIWPLSEWWIDDT